MTIFFKNGETLHISGKEGDRLKKMIAYAVEKGKFGYITLYHENKTTGEEEELEMVLNLQEVAAVR